MFLREVGNGLLEPISRPLWHIQVLKAFTLVSDSLVWKPGSPANSLCKLSMLLTYLYISVLVCRSGIIIVTVSQSCCKD